MTSCQMVNLKMDLQRYNLDIRGSRIPRKTISNAKIMEGNNEYERGLFNILDISACIGSDLRIKGSLERLTNSYRDGSQYIPNLQVVPLLSSISEDSYSEDPQRENDGENNYYLNKDVVTLLKPNDGPTKAKIKVVDLSKDKKLIDVNRMTSLGDIYPTKEKNVNKKKESLSDILPEKSDNTLALEQELGVQSLPFSTVAFSVLKTKPNKDPTNKIEGVNHKYKEYIGACEENISSSSKEYTKIPEMLRAVTLKNNNKDQLVCNSAEKPYLRLFDSKKYSLRDRNGSIIRNLSGKHLILMKNGVPVWDYCKNLSSDENIAPPRTEVFKDAEKVSNITLYDYRGYPLIDYNGAPLITATGKKLIVTDQNGKLLHDVNGNPIFDGAGIPLTKTGDSWLNPRGTPYRVFDQTQYPLTDNQGRTIIRKNKEELLKLDVYGRPILDYNGKLVFDASGHVATDREFNPTLPEECKDDNIAVLIGTVPVQIYDRQGFPLTDSNGIVLKDSSGKYLLSIDFLNNICISRCKTATSANGKLNLTKIQKSHKCRKDHRKAKPFNRRSRYSGLNIRITDSDISARPIEDNSSYSADNQDQMISIGTTESSYFGETAYDSIPMVSQGEKNRTNESINEFISDTSALRDYSSDSAIYTVETSNQDFERDADVYGRPLRDREGQPVFDEYGRPLRDLYSRPLYYRRGCRLDHDGPDTKRTVHLGFDKSYLTRHDPGRSLNLKDRNGGPIHDSLGRPLYNEAGAPLSDAFGRPLYDRNGRPLCDEEGFPASEAVQQKGLRIKDVTDTFEKLYVYSRKQHHPKLEGSVFDGSNNTRQHDVAVVKARVRITTFANEEKVLELLELVPSYHN